MTHNFFSRFKSHFDQDLGGRYLSIILCELINENPSVISKALGMSLPSYKGIHAEVEYSYRGSKLTSSILRSDIAVFGADDKLCALIEVKYEDEKGKGVPEQLHAYMNFCKSRRIPFIYLTKNRIPPEDLRSLTKYTSARHVLLSEMTDALKSSVDGRTSVRMFVDHIREECGMFNDSIEEKALQYLVVKSLGFRHKHGLGRLRKVDRLERQLPGTLASLIGNTTVVAELLDENVFSRFATKAKSSPKVGGFRIIPELTPKLLEQIEERKNDYLYWEGGRYCMYEEIDHGQYCVWANMHLGKVGVEFGYAFRVDRSESDRGTMFRKRAYASIYRTGAKAQYYGYVGLKGYNREQFYLGCLKSIIKALAYAEVEPEFKHNERIVLRQLKQYVRNAQKA